MKLVRKLHARIAVVAEVVVAAVAAVDGVAEEEETGNSFWLHSVLRMYFFMKFRDRATARSFLSARYPVMVIGMLVKRLGIFG